VEEVIEQLREANEPVPVPLELPDEDQLVEIEEELFINIPFVFKEYLLTVSDVVYGSLEPVTVTDPQSHTYLPACPATSYRSARTETISTASKRTAPWCCGPVKRKSSPRKAGNRSGTGRGMSGWKAE